MKREKRLILGIGRRAAIAGTVVDGGTEKPVAGATVEIKKGPKAFEAKRQVLAALPDGERLLEGFARARSRFDGGFVFVDRRRKGEDGTPVSLDLPVGRYVLAASADGYLPIANQAVGRAEGDARTQYISFRLTKKQG